MSGLLILGVFAAVGFAGLGLQVLALHLGRVPVDDRRPEPLAIPSRRRPEPAHSAELRRLVSVVTNAILNERSAKAELQAVLDQLDASATPFAEPATGHRHRRRRSERIDQALTELEHRWLGEDATS